MTAATLKLDYSSYQGALSTNEFRDRALERLYARREAVDTLIQSLEEYQEIKAKKRAPCVSINAARK